MSHFLAPCTPRRRPSWIAILAGVCLWFGIVPGTTGFEIPRIDFQPRQYVCSKTDLPMTLDGKLSEPAWRLATPTAEFMDIQGPSRPTPEFPTTVRMLYDDKYFYFSSQLEEPHVWATLKERDSVIYHDNDFEVFIDPDGDNHLYYELEINALGTEWDLMLIRPYRDGGPAVNAWDIQGLKTGVQVDGTLNDPSDVDGGWTVEIAIPWEVLGQAAGRPVPPEPGDIWRVNFSRVQWRIRPVAGGYEKERDPETDRPLPEDNWVWSPQGLIAMHCPEMWGEVMFGGEEDLAFETSAEHAAIAAAARLMPLYYLQRQWREDQGEFAFSLTDLGLPPDTLPVWHEARAAYLPAPLPAGWTLSLEGGGRRFTATLVSPHGTATVDQDGRLERKP